MTWITEEDRIHNEQIQARWNRTVLVKSGQYWHHKKEKYIVRISYASAQLWCTGKIPDEPAYTRPCYVVYAINENIKTPWLGRQSCSYDDFLNDFCLVK